MNRQLVEQHIVGILEGVTKLAQRLGMIDVAAELRACRERIETLDTATIIYWRAVPPNSEPLPPIGLDGKAIEKD